MADSTSDLPKPRLLPDGDPRDRLILTIALLDTEIERHRKGGILLPGECKAVYHELVHRARAALLAEKPVSATQLLAAEPRPRRTAIPSSPPAPDAQRSNVEPVAIESARPSLKTTSVPLEPLPKDTEIAATAEPAQEAPAPEEVVTVWTEAPPAPTVDDAAQLVARFKATGRMQKELAEAAGIYASDVSCYLKGTYRSAGNTAKIRTVLDRWETDKSAPEPVPSADEEEGPEGPTVGDLLEEAEKEKKAKLPLGSTMFHGWEGDEAAVRQAVAEGKELHSFRFDLHYDPSNKSYYPVKMYTKAVAGCRALMRWTREGGRWAGSVLPGADRK